MRFKQVVWQIAITHRYSVIYKGFKCMANCYKTLIIK